MSMFYELMMRKKGMPSRYQEVEYIESTGTQYIDTGIKASHSLSVDITFQNVGSAQGYIFGSADSFGTNMFNLLHYISGNENIFYLQNTNFYFLFLNQGADEFKKTRFITEPSGQNRTFKNYVEGVLKTNTSHEDATSFSNSNIFLFSTSGLTSSYSGKIFSAQMKIDGSLVRNFIPVYDTLTNKYGMWESVQGKFYGNAGTGDFKGSIVGYTIVGSPTITDGVVSGFSDSNYLQINSGISVGQNFEIYTKFTTGASLSSNQELMVGKISSDLYLRIFIQNGATLFTSARVVGASSISHNQTSYSFQTNTTYFVKVKYDGANKLDVFIYDNTGQQVKTNSFTLSNQINTFNSLLIGTVGTPSSVWGGSIDLNETYIKINNKLWFNGQQA